MKKIKLFTAIVTGTMIVGRMISIHAASDYDTYGKVVMTQEVESDASFDGNASVKNEETPEAKKAAVKAIVTRAIANALNGIRSE